MLTLLSPNKGPLPFNSVLNLVRATITVLAVSLSRSLTCQASLGLLTPHWSLKITLGALTERAAIPGCHSPPEKKPTLAHLPTFHPMFNKVLHRLRCSTPPEIIRQMDYIKDMNLTTTIISSQSSINGLLFGTSGNSVVVDNVPQSRSSFTLTHRYGVRTTGWHLHGRDPPHSSLAEMHEIRLYYPIPGQDHPRL